MITAIESPDAPTPERILFRLKTRGPASTADLARELGMTAEAARQQVQKLLAEGLIAGHQETHAEQAPARAGRPRQQWNLTCAGHGRFPDTHAQLTVQLIGAVRDLFGDAGLDRLIGQREASMRDDYLRQCGPIKSLRGKLDKLAAIRSAEGYMARVELQGDDWLLVEDHCPICAAAQTCQGFCRSELTLFSDVVGERGQVTREEHLPAGARRCAYRITPA